MASVLEMAVCFLQLAHSMAPGWEQLSVSCKQVGLVRLLQYVYCMMSLFGGSILLASLGPTHLSAQTCILHPHDASKPYQLVFS